MIRVEVEGKGQVAEFPDGTSQDVIDSAIKRDYFSQPANAQVDDVPEWGRKSPNLYGAYGAGKAIVESIPYAKYAFPENRESFMQKNQQGQTNELLKETLNAELFLAADPVLKAVGQVAKPLIGKAKGLFTKADNVKPVETVAPKEDLSALNILDETPKGEIPNSAVSNSIIPEVKGGNVGELPKYAEGSSINLEKLNTTEDLKQFINQRTKTIEDTIGKRTQGWEETRAKAEELGWDGRDIINTWRKKGSFNAAEMDAARQTNLNTITTLHEKLRNLPSDVTKLSPELRAEVLDAMQLVKTTSQASSEAGRALNIHKRVLQNDPEFRQTSLFNKALHAIEGKGAKRTDDLINKLRDIDFTDPAQVNRFIYNATKTPWQKLSDGAYELWINGLLSNPLTHIVNTTSNALTMAYTIPERALATGIDVLRSTLPKQSRELFMGETKQELFAFHKSFFDGIRRFGEVMKKGENVTKLDYKPSAFPDKIAKFMPTRALTAEDAFFKGIIQNSEINRLAYRQATKEGLKGKAFQERLTELLSNPSEQMLEGASKRGQYLTYQKDLGEFANGVMRMREIGGNLNPLKYFIPFVKTPTNIAKFALERTPLNFPLVISKAMKGQLKGAELSENLAKPLMGSILATTVYTLAENGYITGGTPKNKNERDEKLATGWQPYSIKLGDKYYSFQRLEPLGSILGMTADMNQIKKSMSEDEKYNLGVGVLGSITTNLSNKTFMQGFTNIINAISDPGRYGENALKNLSGTLIPSVSAGVARSIDPYFRDTKEVSSTLQNRIPGASEELTPRLTIWGEPIEKPGNAATRFLSPVPVSQEKGSPIEKELLNLDLDISYPPRKIAGADLTTDEYWSMVQSAGRPTRQILDAFAQSPQWLNKSNYEKEKDINSIVDKYRRNVHNQMVLKLFKEGRLKATNEKEQAYLQNKVSAALKELR